MNISIFQLFKNNEDDLGLSSAFSDGQSYLGNEHCHLVRDVAQGCQTVVAPVLFFIFGT
jgi:hypothetical protein